MAEDQANIKTRQKKVGPKKNIVFDYENEDLINIINEIAAKKQVNIILPIKADQVIKNKVTIHLNNKISLDDAWRMLIMLIDYAGYSIIQEGDIYEIVKNSKDINREPLPLFVGINSANLPDNDQRIRYIYYLANLKISPNVNSEKKNNELYALLSVLMPELKDTPNFYLDPVTNSIIFSEKSESIKSAVQVIKQLDGITIEEKMEFLKLRYLDAKFVADLFNKEITPPIPNTYLVNQPSDAGYFSMKLKIMPDTKNNALIILGKTQAIERVKDFIFKYLDVPVGEGHSMLHVYQLQYLDAGEFAPILQSVVKNESKKSTGQSTTQGATSEGPERFFGEVIIKSDAPENKSVEVNKYWGGNKLVISCSSDDWLRIKPLIEQLDVPQAQVVIEVLIAELTSTQTRQLGSMLRNPACFPFPKGMNAQSAQLTGIITNGTQAGITPAIPTTTIQADLLGNVLASGGSTGVSLINPSYTEVGTSALAISDKNGAVWTILEVFDFITWQNIVTNPHVIATNNKETRIEATQSRFLIDRAANTAGSGATEIVNKWVNAPVVVKVTPRISATDTVNLQLDISIDEFTTSSAATTSQNPAEQTRNTRKLTTNANVTSGGILTVGGLSRHDDSDNTTRTPILGQLPIIGYLFKNRSKAQAETSLTVFICPTIIQPRLRSGISTYTTDYVNLTKNYIKHGGLFESLNEPITRWFFNNSQDDPVQDIDDFMNEDALRKKEQLMPLQQKQAQGKQQADSEYRVVDDTSTDNMNDENVLPPSKGAHLANNTGTTTQSPIRTSVMALANNQTGDDKPTQQDPSAQIRELYKDLKNPLLSVQQG